MAKNERSKDLLEMSLSLCRALRDMVRIGDYIPRTIWNFRRVLHSGIIWFGKHFKEIPMATDWTMALEFGRGSVWQLKDQLGVFWCSKSERLCWLHQSSKDVEKYSDLESHLRQHQNNFLMDYVWCIRETTSYSISTCSGPLKVLNELVTELIRAR